MLAKRFSLLFYLKKPKNYLKGKQPIYMRITIDAARVELSMQRECEAERWNSNAGRASGTKEETKSLNVHLTTAHKGKVWLAGAMLVMDSSNDESQQEMAVNPNGPSFSYDPNEPIMCKRQVKAG